MHYSHVNIYGGLIENGTATNNSGNIHCGNNITINISGTESSPVVIRGGTAQNYGNLRITGTPILPGVILNGGAPEVAAVWTGDKLIGQYKTISEAISAADSNCYIQLLSDVNETSTVNGDLYIDLNGHNLTGITCNGTVYGMDSTTKDYDDSLAGSMQVTGNVATVFKTAAAMTGKTHQYLAVKTDNGYSFHRYYMGLTAISLSPGNTGMGYKATFAGSETVKAQLQGYGMGISFDPLAESLASNVYKTKSADKFTAGTPFTQKLLVRNILKTDIPENHNYATSTIYARCFIRLKDGTTLFSDQLGGNLMDLVEAVDDNWSSYSTAQKNAVAAMLAQYPLSTGGWGIKNAHHHDGQVWKPWTGKWESGGHYYLTTDYTLTSTITVAANQNLTICLNGHRFQGTASRMFKVFGTLNIHDHRENDGTYAGKLVSTYGTPVMAPVFYVYENGCMNVSGGNLTYEGTATMTRGGIGMVGSNDQSYDSNTTEDPAYFYMYYGNIYGGKVQAKVVNGAVSGSHQGLGGNLDLVNHGVVTMYRGAVSGGTATHVDADGANGMGGNICLSSKNTVLNLYSVDITGGSSGVYMTAGKVNLYNDVNITGNTDYNLYVAANKTVTANNLKNATVGVTTPGTAVFATVADPAYADCFTADQPNVWVVNTDGHLTICHGHCVCGNCAEGVGNHNCEGITYTAIPAGTTDLGALKSGNYYLTGDIVATGVTNFSNKNVKICLNGYSITPGSSVDAPLGRVRAGAELSICDCSGEQAANGNWTFDGAIYAGTRTYGGVTNVNANGKLYIYGGNYIGTTGNTSGGVFNVCNDGHGGASGAQTLDIYDTQFNMYNGFVQGGTVTKDGGAINCWHHIKLNIYGGVITGGTAGEDGGNLSTSGIVNITGGVIKNGTATVSGGNIRVQSGQIRIANAAVTGGQTPAKGGNIYIPSGTHLYLDSVTITGGTADMGGGVFNYMSTVHVAGDTIINYNTGYNLHQYLSMAVDVGALGSNARIGIYSEVKGKLLNSTAYRAQFFSEDPNYSLVSYQGSTLYLKAGTTLNYSAVSGFSAGYGEVDVSPTENGVPLGGYGTSEERLSTEVDPYGRLYVMTTAITDADGNTVLIVACDQIRFTDTVTSTIREHMSAATGVPADHIYINCSHTHSTPEPSSVTDEALRYRALMFNGFVESGILAMKDRQPATMQTGSFDLTGPKGTGTLNFTRHYQHTTSDGVVKYFGDNFGTAVYDSTTKPVDDVDPTMHLVKFVRSGKDILLCNWRAHPHFTGGSAKTLVSSDYIGPFRDQAEKLLGDVEVVFIQGAAGNVNEKSRLSSLNHGYTGDTAHVTYGKEMARQLKNNIGVLKTAPTGSVQTKQILFTATVDHSTDVLYSQAKEVQDTYYDLDTTARKELLAKYGFSSVYHAGAILARYNMDETKEAEVNVFSIGDQVGFYTVPGELWCSASEEVEAASPFPVTFCVGYSLGDYKYFTYGTAWNYSSYESANYRLTVPDTIYTMLDYWKNGLTELFNN